LHWPDLDRQTGELYIHRSLEDRNGVRRLKETKTPKGRRRVRLAPRTLAALDAHRERMRAEGRDLQAGPIFPDTEGGFLHQSNFANRVMRPVLKAAGLDGIRVRPYDLRYTSATLLLSKDVNVKVVSERLGHESIDITLKHYAHALPSMQERAAAAVETLLGSIVPPASHGSIDEEESKTLN
jgi:integrase